MYILLFVESEVVITSTVVCLKTCFHNDLSCVELSGILEALFIMQLFFVVCTTLSLNAKELAQLLKRVDAEISNCESCHHDEIEKRKKYKVCDRELLGFLVLCGIYTVICSY